MKNKKAFTLIELLVVVLIIGILAAIAVPQYQKAVLKADLHRGVSLVESLYQAQQAYYLAHGDYAWDIDALDISIPKDSSCEKGESGKTVSYYDCDFGRIYVNTNESAIQFQDKPYRPNISRANIAYTHYLKDIDDKKANKRYCAARHEKQITQDVCQGMGGVFFKDQPGYWIIYEID